MRKIVKIVYSTMYQEDTRVSFREKVLVTLITISILSMVISIAIIETV
jgi:hypothetical protein